MNTSHKIWVKNRLAGFPPYQYIRRRQQASAWEDWQQAPGPDAAPHLVKEHAVIQHARRYGIRTFVETGVLFGEMLAAVRPYFDTLYGIELDPSLCQGAQRRFEGQPSIHILEGDSGVVLPRLAKSFTQPVLFWLDGHYSGGITAKGTLETPVSAELDVLLAHPVRNHVILIDDARCFDGTHDYPRLADLEASVRSRRPDLAWEVSHDMIRILPPRQT